MASKNDIVLEGIGKSTLLTEVSRSFLHTGTPSAMLHYIAQGIRRNVSECESEEDRIFLTRFAQEMSDMKDKWSKSEDSYYLDPANKDVG